MRVIFNENQIKNFIQEMAYPSSFNFNEFRSLKSFSDRVKYCDKYLTKIGAGSSRIVYQVDNEKVLKLAKNQKGIAQNEVEIEVSADYYSPSVVAKTFEYDENGLWVEMEYAQKIKASDIKEVLKNITYKEFFYIIDELATKLSVPKNLKYKVYNESEETSEFFNDVHDYLANFEGTRDISRPSAWGTVIRDGKKELVIIDYGANKDVIKNYYSI